MSEATRRALALLAIHEGFSPKCYKDTSKTISYDGTPGLWTCLYGWCLETRPLTQEDIDILKVFVVFPQEALGNIDLQRKIIDGLSPDLARRVGLQMLKEEVESVESNLETVVGCWGDLNPMRRAALIDLAYNMGINGLKGFPSMLRALAGGNWNEASLQLLFVDPHVNEPKLSDYASPPPIGVGSRRSGRIAQMLLSGLWPSEVPYEE